MSTPTSTLIRSIVAAAVAAGLAGCAAPEPPPLVRDRLVTVVAADHVAPVSTDASPRTFVPWDSAAVLDVATDADAPVVAPGSLVVRYGKSSMLDGGRAHALYVLGAPGPRYEPLSLHWQPASGHDLRAIVRVDGTVRRFDFDR